MIHETPVKITAQFSYLKYIWRKFKFRNETGAIKNDTTLWKKRSRIINFHNNTAMENSKKQTIKHKD